MISSKNPVGLRNRIQIRCLIVSYSRLVVALFATMFSSIVSSDEPRRLTLDGALKFTPVFSQRGESILYSTHDEPNRVTLMRLTISSGVSERIDESLSAHQLDPDISLDGRHLCFVLTYTSPQSILVIRDLKDGSEARYIPVEARGTVRGPRISPDQKFVVFTLSDPGGQQIARVDINGQNLKRLTSTVGLNAWPSISP
ncbi:MAG: hypothetical protein FJ267_20250, partial [Planctomycetes bacterium]|nr:hypothetical protein [Planctomycetota bacterium]